jgi:diaminopimelate decarboxylase
MTEKKLPFNEAQIREIAEKYPTPFHIYDEEGIRDTSKGLYAAFKNLPGFKNYFAVKALPNPHILKLLKEEGMGADCSSLPELILAERTGITGEDIMFTSNDTPANEFKKAMDLGAIINLDDISHFEFLEKTAGIPDLIFFRYNPGALKKGNAIIGNPEEAKYGFTKEQLIEGYSMAKKKGVTRFGLHTMVASNELDPDYFIETANLLFRTAVEIKETLGIIIEIINLGGGIGIPYRPDQTNVDIDKIGREVEKFHKTILKPAGLGNVKIVMENGRMITGPHGYLVTRVIHKKNTYKNFIGTDANMANLMRPAIYGAYHHITVLGKEDENPATVYDVTGSLCENNDKFAIDRKLPEIEIGDILVIHDTGAHGHSMGFNYNGKLRSAELLLTPEGGVRQIRRAETLDDYFATLDFS